MVCEGRSARSDREGRPCRLQPRATDAIVALEGEGLVEHAIDAIASTIEGVSSLEHQVCDATTDDPTREAC